MRLAVPIAIVALAATLLGGCGGSSSGSDSNSSGGPNQADDTTTASTTGTAPAGASATSCDAETSSVEALSATAVPCAEARAVMRSWQGEPGCAAEPGASHSACTVRVYRCISARGDRGLVVSCARPGHSMTFIVKG